ncbi:hypothetical protein ACLFKT_37815, partial [Paraburkholderia sp. BR14261]
MRLSVQVGLGALVAGLLLGASLFAVDKSAVAATQTTKAAAAGASDVPASAPAATPVTASAAAAASAPVTGPVVIQTAPGSVIPEPAASTPLGQPRTRTFTLRQMGAYGP